MSVLLFHAELKTISLYRNIQQASHTHTQQQQQLKLTCILAHTRAHAPPHRQCTRAVCRWVYLRFVPHVCFVSTFWHSDELIIWTLTSPATCNIATLQHNNRMERGDRGGGRCMCIFANWKICFCTLSKQIVERQIQNWNSFTQRTHLIRFQRPLSLLMLMLM